MLYSFHLHEIFYSADERNERELKEKMERTKDAGNNL